MSDGILNEVLPAIAERRTSRRRLLGQAAVAAGVVAGAGLTGTSRRQSAGAATLGLRYGPKGARIKVKDTDILNFALNLEYLEAEFYQRAAYGVGLPSNLVTGKQSLGAVVGGRKVQFTNPIVADYAVEIANDEKNHVIFLKSALGSRVAQRFLKAAPKLAAPEGLYDEFAARFPYDETDDQLSAIEAVMEDLATGRPMDRLICGDVGFGKTEVALRAAFAAVMSGKQVAVVVPTTLLARQHFKTFADRFRGLTVNVAQASRFVGAVDM